MMNHDYDRNMAEVYCFGEFELQPDCLQLRCAGAILKIEPKPLQVLVMLVANRGQLVTKNELMDGVWAGRVVTESVIARCINKLRTVLNDESQMLITTVHGYGYRFVGNVRRVPGGRSAETSPAPSDACLVAGSAVPLRPRWRLSRALSPGSVWLAEHEKTGERRVFKFALEPQQVRILKRELTMHRVLRRGLGDRTGIVRLLDYNLEVPPYFLEMEYCSQGNLCDWCSSQGGVAAVPLASRLEIIAQAAETLAAAHALGVLHLDVKPSNLLVESTDNCGVRVRLADFGSSRLLVPELLSEFDITRLASTRTLGIEGPLEGTLQYTAPEVWKGEAATARADIYALGVMLYQLLAGDLRKPLAAGWELSIDDELLRDDVASAANGNPALRLSSADELARRLHQLEQRRAALDGERARARESADLQRRLERARARRPWVIAAVAALCAGLVASLWSYRDALRSRDQAKQEEAIAKGVGQFLSEDVLGAPSRFAPSVRRDVRVVDVLDRAALELDHRPPDAPLIEAAVRSSIAYSYLQMSSYAAARQQTAKAARLYARVLGATDSRTLHTEYEEAEDLIFDSKYAEAEQLLDRLDADLARHPAGDPDVYLASAVLRGAVYFHAERFSQALPYYEKALIEHQRIHPTEPAGLSVREQMLAFTYAHLGRFGAADRAANQALAAARQVTDSNADTTLALARETRGVVLYLERLYPQAEQELTESYRVLSARLGADAEESADSRGYLGRVYLLSGRSSAAEQILRPTYAGVVARFGENGRSTALVQTDLGVAECENGEWQAGLNDLRHAVAALRVILGENAPSTQWARYNLASAVLQSKSDAAEAVSLRSGLNAALLGLVDPKQPWSAMLKLLDGQLRLASSERQP